MPEHWREWLAVRGMHELDTIAYPNNAPLTARPDWRPPHGKAGSDLNALREQALIPFKLTHAICNCLYGVHFLFSEELAAVYASAVNDWMVNEWLDPEPKLRASIVIPMQNPEMAVAEIERCATDRRFVQVLMLVMGDMPLGRRHFWPIYDAAERHGLPIGIHAGSSYRQAVTAAGWPSYYTEDYAAQAVAFQSQLTNLISEGVFSKFPTLKMVFLESGFTWLPAHMWRMTKGWRALRREIPWVDRSPSEIVRSNIRLTTQPIDAPPTPEDFERLLDQMGSDELLLFSTDYPHWQFDGDMALPDHLPADLVRKIMIDNPRATYPRLKEDIQ